MADEEIKPTDEGAGDGITAAMQDAGQSSQEDGKGQEPSQTSQADKSERASSAGKQSSKHNSAWATERIVEKAVKRNIENALAPILEKLNSLQGPAAPQKQTQESDLGTPDYNNLNQWLESAVNKLLEKQLKESLPKFKSEVTGELKSVSKTQEARNYLLSQEDIKDNDEAIEELEQIMKREMLDYAYQVQPLRTVRKAVEIWRKEKKNPNAPTKEQLSTVSGGIVNRGKKELSIQELKDIQRKIASGLPIEENEKLGVLVDSL